LASVRPGSPASVVWSLRVQMTRSPVLDGAQDSDGGGLERYWGIRWGMTGEAAGGVFVVGGTWPMGVGWVRRLEVTML
jgi:hypothetical protein